MLTIKKEFDAKGNLSSYTSTVNGVKFFFMAFILMLALKFVVHIPLIVVFLPILWIVFLWVTGLVMALHTAAKFNRAHNPIKNLNI